MKIEKIVDQKIISDFVTNNTSETFLQSWEWGNFNTLLGHKVWFFGIYENDLLISTALVIKISARRGRFLFIPHGPVIARGATEKYKPILEVYVSHLKQMAKEHNCSFIRIAPLAIDNERNKNIFKELSFNNAPMHMHSELCWVLNIEESEDQLLNNMRKTTRYLIKQQEKYNIKITKSQNIADLDRFYKVYDQTQKRQKFVAFSNGYLKQEFKAFSKNSNAFLYFAYHNKTLLSTAFVIVYGKTGFYHHGASSHTMPKLPASYILQWEIIRDLKKMGCCNYNFWGIAPENKPKHPWKGLTIFKKGFGGGEVAYLHAQDLKINWGYWPNWIIETTRRIKRQY